MNTKEFLKIEKENKELMCKNNITTKEGKESLTKRAVRTMGNSFLVNIIQVVVGFLVTPIIITGLGAELYGAWQMILQAMQYLARGDLRPMGTLRIFLSVEQHNKNFYDKQRLIGAAVVISLCMMPIILAIGCFLVYFSPSYIHVSPQFQESVKIAMVISIICISIEKFLSVPTSVLAGMNLEYKAMGLNAFTLLVGALLSLGAIKFGYGLPGLAASTLFGVFITGGTRYWVVKRFIPWFKVARPKIAELKQFTKKSGWFFGSSMADALVNVSDLLIIGAILGPATAAIYATTGAVLRLSSAPILKILNSVSAGVGGLCGRKEWEKVLRVRSEMQLIIIFILTIIGSGVLILNKTFLSLWIGPGFYGGNMLNCLLVVIFICQIIISPNEMIIDNLLLFREKFIIKLIAGLSIVIIGIISTKYWGMAGFALSSLLGRFFILIAYSLTVKKYIYPSESINLISIVRPIIISSMILTVAFLYPYGDAVESWMSFFFHCFIATCFLTLSIWHLSLNKSNKIVVKNRLAIITRNI